MEVNFDKDKMNFEQRNSHGEKPKPKPKLVKSAIIKIKEWRKIRDLLRGQNLPSKTFS